MAYCVRLHDLITEVHVDTTWKELLENEQVFFSITSKILAEPPTSQLLETLKASGAFAGTPFAAHRQECQEGLALLSVWPKDSDKGIDKEYQDYLALFGVVGRPLASPWGSSYLNETPGMVFQLETLEVRSWYQRFGMQVRKKYHEPDDFIAYELEFICHLVGKALSALEAEDEEHFMLYWDAQGAFLHEHLLKWGFMWSDCVIENSKTDFYKGIAKLVKGALRELEEQYKE
jgi:TorA maturation chaperone TorD